MVLRSHSRHLGLPASLWAWLGDVTAAAGGGWLAEGGVMYLRVVNEVKVVGKLSRTLPLAPFADFHIPGFMGGDGDGGGAADTRRREGGA